MNKLYWCLLLAGCATEPPAIEWSFNNFETIEAQATYPRELGRIKELECWPTSQDCQVAGYSSTADIDALEAYKIKAEGNTTIAAANAAAVDLLIEQQQALVTAGIAEENIRKIREEQLAWEKRERLREKWWYRALLVGTIALGIYTD